MSGTYISARNSPGAPCIRPLSDPEMREIATALRRKSWKPSRRSKRPRERMSCFSNSSLFFSSELSMSSKARNANADMSS